MSDNAGERPEAFERYGDVPGAEAAPAPVAGPEPVPVPHQEDAEGRVAEAAQRREPYVQPALDRVRALWDPAEPDGDAAATTATATRTAAPPEKPAGPPKATRAPLTGLVWLLVLSLSAAFFAWVSAEPLWLSVGHYTTGRVTVASCEDGGAGFACSGAFVSDDGDTSIPYATITGDGGDDLSGRTLPARVVSERARTIYTGDTAGLFLRWGLGLTAVLICAVALTFASGAWRLAGRHRTAAVSAGFAAPLLLAAGIIAAAA